VARRTGGKGDKPRARRMALVSGLRVSRAQMLESIAEMVIRNSANFILRKDRRGVKNDEGDLFDQGGGKLEREKIDSKAL